MVAVVQQPSHGLFCAWHFAVALLLIWARFDESAESGGNPHDAAFGPFAPVDVSRAEEPKEMLRQAVPKSEMANVSILSRRT